MGVFISLVFEDVCGKAEDDDLTYMDHLEKVPQRNS